MSSKVKSSTRVVTDDDVKKYEPLIDKYLRDSVVKNWNEASTSLKDEDVSLGNSGWTMGDIRQYLRAEVYIALKNFNPNFITPEGRTVKEFTFVFNHLRFRVGQLMKKLAKLEMGYGIWTSNIEEVLWEIDKEV